MDEEDPKAAQARTAGHAVTASAGPARGVDLPAPAPGGLCLDCGVPLYFREREGALPAGFACKKCGRNYRGATEWSVTAPMLGAPTPPQPEQLAPDAPAPFPLVPDWKWVGKKRRKK